jgi:peptidyl-prolyl cis-trans isomerase A (cyclophilin A)
MLKKISLLFLSAIFLSACTTKPISPLVNDNVIVNNQESKQMTATTIPTENLPTSVTINTSLGAITLELYPSKAPKTVKNFIDLSTASEGKQPFYNNLIFHRVISDFMIQGGDPLGNGTGGPGYSFEDEFNQGLTFDKAGILAMANSGPNTNGSQFFITLAPTPWLNGKHTIFGQVTAGMDVLEKIGSVEVGAQDKPLTDVVIESINVTP